jgi:hypothetical protein
MVTRASRRERLAIAVIMAGEAVLLSTVGFALNF